MEINCQDCEQLLAAFALGALDVDERLMVETHLETCASCRQILADYQAVGDGLMYAMPPTQPPAGLRARLLAKTAPTPPKPDKIERWQLLFPRLMSAVGIVTLLVLVVFNLNLLVRTNQVLQTQESLTQQSQASQTALALMTYPGSQVAVIESGNIYGTLVFNPEGELAVLNVWGLNDLQAGQDYQVWLIEPDQTRISGGVFRSSDDMGFVSFVIKSSTSMDSFTGIGVTIEPEGGSPSPTGPRVFGVQL